MVVFNLGSDYGYVVLAASGSWLLNFWQSIKIGGKRKELGIKYPEMYSDKHPIFNCYQRAHQNTLEQMPFYFAMLFAGGVRHPLVASSAGAAFLLGRVVYSMGYYTGQPEKRVPGFVVSLLGLMTLFGCTVSTAAGFLGWW